MLTVYIWAEEREVGVWAWALGLRRDQGERRCKGVAEP